METPSREESTEPVAHETLLALHHRDLDRRFEALLAAADEADPTELRAAWTSFERDLSRHMEVEEEELLPRFARKNPEETAALWKEHASIRALLLELGVSLDLHYLRADTVRELIEQLRDHARREERLLYPWAASENEPGLWDRLARQLATPPRRPVR